MKVMLSSVLLWAVMAFPAAAVGEPTPPAEVRAAPTTAAETLKALLDEDDALRLEVKEQMARVMRGGPASIRQVIAHGAPDAAAMRAKHQAMSAKIVATLTALVEREGWPKKSVVGDESAETALELVSRVTGDVPFQRWCLDRIEATAAAGEIPAGRRLATLTDLVLVGEGRRQRYGTQFDFDLKATAYRAKPIDDKAHLDERRSTMGLPPFKEELAMRNAMIKEGARRAAPLLKTIKAIAREEEAGQPPASP